MSLEKYSLKEVMLDRSYTGSSLIIKYKGLYLFGLKKRDNDNFGITCIGGKVESGETFTECAVRESIEEIGVKPTIKTSNVTALIDLSNNLCLCNVETNPLAVVQKRINILENNVSIEKMLTIVVYSAFIEDDPKPIENLPVLFAVKQDSIYEIVNRKIVTFDDILKMSQYIDIKKGSYISNVAKGEFIDSPEILFKSIIANNKFEILV